MKRQRTYYAIGLMSGSSLDGLDIARVRFVISARGWHFTICEAETIPLPGHLYAALCQIQQASDVVLRKVDKELGDFMGKAVRSFIRRHRIRRVDVIGSHGHTVRHHPEKKQTIQIGSARMIANHCHIPVVWNLRKKDVLNGGQGAPIVPIADWHLFPKYGALLNLGGIANVSVKTGDTIQAWDICPFNQVFNEYAQKEGNLYDRGGQMAAKGKVHEGVLKKLLQIPYFRRKPPKSLDNAFSKEVIDMMDAAHCSPADASATWAKATAFLIARDIPEGSSVYVTGGGAFHRTAIQFLRRMCKGKVILGDKEMIHFKEALAMAFMAVLRVRGEVNVLSSVTGAKRDSVCGDMYNPVFIKISDE